MENYTKEQLKIINSRAKIISVESPPGSGKTYCILGIVKKHPKKFHLILAFNNAIKNALKEKIENERIENAEVFTFHSLAYDFFKNGTVIKNFENRKLENLDYFSLEKIMKKLELDISKTYEYLLILYSFFKSSETLSGFLKKNNKKDLSKPLKKILEYIKKDEKCPMFHEFYIKFFQLMSYSNSKYDTVLIDESQDKTECYNSIVRNLKTDRIIHFGDNFQKIYGYNGAMGMEASEFKLTKSFRIGKDHAFLCNSLIKTFINKKEKGFEGLNINGKIVKELDNDKKSVTICRTNNEILKRTLNDLKNGRTVMVLGGAESAFNLSLIELFAKASKEFPKYYKGKKITNIWEVEELYLKSRSWEIKNAINFIKEFKKDTMKVVNFIRMGTVDEVSIANQIYVTAHKAKGLEFNYVTLADDFPTISSLKEKLSLGKDITGEIFALYVALSRSKGQLKLNKDLDQWYEELKNGESKEIVVKFKEVIF